ncbi:hypothetical protein AVEN_106707-1, partial [Araneus ventricosus]
MWVRQESWGSGDPVVRSRLRVTKVPNWKPDFAEDPQ